MGVETTINIQLIESPKIGEYVLVHGGCAIEKINRAYFDDLFNPKSESELRTTGF